MLVNATSSCTVSLTSSRRNCLSAVDDVLLYRFAVFFLSWLYWLAISNISWPFVWIDWRLALSCASTCSLSAQAWLIFSIFPFPFRINLFEWLAKREQVMGKRTNESKRECLCFTPKLTQPIFLLMEGQIVLAQPSWSVVWLSWRPQVCSNLARFAPLTSSALALNN